MIINNNFTISKLTHIVFIGQSECLKELLSFNQKLKIKSFVITSPDQEKEINLSKKYYKVFSNLDKSFQIFVKKKFNINETLFISLSSRWIFNNKIINFLNNNLINFHSSRLPFLRGGATFSWQIMKQDRIHCQTVHLVNPGVDEGPVLLLKESIYPSHCILPKDFYDHDRKKLTEFYIFFLTTLIKKKFIKLQYQNEVLSNYFPRINSKKDSWIDWKQEPIELINFINAFDDPYEGAKTFLNGKKVFLKKCQLHYAEAGGHPFMSGIVLRKSSEFIIVALDKRFHLIIESLRNEKNKDIFKMVKVGDRFYTKEIDLYKSKSIRAKFNSLGLKKSEK